MARRDGLCHGLHEGSVPGRLTEAKVGGVQNYHQDPTAIVLRIESAEDSSHYKLLTHLRQEFVRSFTDYLIQVRRKCVLHSQENSENSGDF
jgi:hypothetical protein